MFIPNDDEGVTKVKIPPLSGGIPITPVLFSRNWTRCFVTAHYVEISRCQINPVPPHQLPVATPTTSIRPYLKLAEHFVMLSLLVLDSPAFRQLENYIIIGQDTIEQLRVSNGGPSIQPAVSLTQEDVDMWSSQDCFDTVCSRSTDIVDPEKRESIPLERFS